jgi:serine/threonine protein kinase
MTTPAAEQRPGGSELLDGRYRLEAVVGTGGYARVYRSTDESLGRTVAVKLFTVDAADSRDLSRRESETRLLAALSHPSLVTLFDAKLDANPAYLVMEFIDGPTLGALIAERPMSLEDAATIAWELGEALQVIHGAGVVHRDIKPSNVLLRPPSTPGASARATLADFGIASLVDSAGVTATGTLVGTAAYLSPEQARGERAVPASDIYSLGLLLLEALTGQRTYPQPTPYETLIAKLARPPAIPADLPPDWRSLLSAMTALDPGHRPDAAAVTRAAARLRGATSPALPPAPGLSHSPVLSTAPTVAVEPAPPTGVTAVLAPALPSEVAAPKRRRGWLLWAAGAAVAAAVAVVVAVSVASGQPPASDPAFPPLPDPLSTHFDELWSTL